MVKSMPHDVVKFWAALIWSNLGCDGHLSRSAVSLTTGKKLILVKSRRQVAALAEIARTCDLYVITQVQR